MAERSPLPGYLSCTVLCSCGLSLGLLSESGGVWFRVNPLQPTITPEPIKVRRPSARGPGVSLPRVRSKLPEGTARSWRLMAETSRAEKFPWSGAWLPRLRFSKADAMLPAGPPPVPQALPIAGGHQGQLVLSSPAFLQEPGHAVGPALPRIQLDQERANAKGGMILDCSGNRAAEPRLGLRGRRAEAHQVRNLRQSAERMSC